MWPEVGSRMNAGALLRASGLPQREARVLLAHVLGVPRERLIARPDTIVPDDSAGWFDALSRRRQEGEPLPYLIGEQEFYGRRFAITRDVLIPRPDTETLVDVTLRCLGGSKSPRMLELGTGSGCIAVTLKLERPDAELTATDLSLAALAVARTNTEAWAAAVELQHGNWFAAVEAAEPFDLVLSNPPYVAVGDPHLETLGHEPPLALSDGADGLRCLSEIIAGAGAHLKPRAWLVLEHGYDQAAAVGELMLNAGFSDVEVERDAAGRERVTRGRIRGVARPTDQR